MVRTVLVLMGAAGAIAVSAGMFHVTTNNTQSSGTLSSWKIAAFGGPALAGGVRGPRWAASATGRMEPKGGEIRIYSDAAGRITDVLATVGDDVRAGDLLIKVFDDRLALDRRAALAEVSVRKRERDAVSVSGLQLRRRAAHDALAKAEDAVVRAQAGYDETVRGRRTSDVSDADVDRMRERLVLKTADRNAKRRAVADVATLPDMPPYLRVESSLIQARVNLRQIEAAIAQTSVRAPMDGTVLEVWARKGELTGPRARLPLVLFGDLKSLQARAEVEERDAPKIAIGQHAVVRADAFPGRDFVGVVREISRSLGQPRIATRGPRRPNDVEVLEVVVALDGSPPLIPGMRVDVFFHAKADAQAAQSPIR